MKLRYKEKEFYMRIDRVSIWSRELGFDSVEDFILNNTNEDMFKMYCYSKIYWN